MPAEGDVGARSGQLCEQVALLVHTFAFDRQLGQDVAQADAQVVRQQRILGDHARKHAAVQSDDEELLEAAGARLHRAQDLDAAALAAQRRVDAALQCARQQQGELLAIQLDVER